jgi:phage baseplate assembly protein W
MGGRLMKPKRYVDLDLDFLPHPVTKDVVLKYDEEAVKRSVRNLVLTNLFEKPFHPEISSNVTTLLFENFNPVIAIRLRNDIERIIRDYEPRVNLRSVNVTPSPDRNLLEIGILFQVSGFNSTTGINIPLERLR